MAVAGTFAKQTTIAPLAALILLGATFARAEVTGRYVRIDSMSMFMEIIELEIDSGGQNLLAGHPELLRFGLGYGFYGADGTGTDGRTSRQAHTLTDGQKDTSKRGIEIGPKHGPHKDRVDRGCLEIDLGTERSLDRAIYYCSRYDAGPRRQWLRDPQRLACAHGSRREPQSRLLPIALSLHARVPQEQGRDGGGSDRRRRSSRGTDGAGAGAVLAQRRGLPAGLLRRRNHAAVRCPRPARRTIRTAQLTRCDRRTDRYAAAPPGSEQTGAENGPSAGRERKKSGSPRCLQGTVPGEKPPA